MSRTIRRSLSRIFEALIITVCIAGVVVLANKNPNYHSTVQAFSYATEIPKSRTPDSTKTWHIGVIKQIITGQGCTYLTIQSANKQRWVRSFANEHQEVFLFLVGDSVMFQAKGFYATNIETNSVTFPDGGGC